MKTLRAKTMVELKSKMRKAFGWPDKRSWSDSELHEMVMTYRIEPDYKTGHYVATPYNYSKEK